MNLMQPKTVAGAVAPLLKVLHNLEGVVDTSGKLAVDNEDKINRLIEENVAAKRESASAKAIIEALSTIINPGVADMKEFLHPEGTQ